PNHPHVARAQNRSLLPHLTGGFRAMTQPPQDSRTRSVSKCIGAHSKIKRCLANAATHPTPHKQTWLPWQITQMFDLLYRSIPAHPSPSVAHGCCFAFHRPPHKILGDLWRSEFSTPKTLLLPPPTWRSVFFTPKNPRVPSLLHTFGVLLLAPYS